MSKGEIAQDEQFLPLSQCFQNSSTADSSKCRYVWERVKQIMDSKNAQCAIGCHQDFNTFLTLFRFSQ